jgi:poly(hydroxyalkanoate) depolymerase family esterase
VATHPCGGEHYREAMGHGGAELRRRWILFWVALCRFLRVGWARGGRWDEYVDHESTGPNGTRSYAVYTPPGLVAGRAVPLVVVLHGCRQSARDAAVGTGIKDFADRAGFVVLLPEQAKSNNPRCCWNWFRPRHQIRGSGEPADIARITQRLLSSSGEVALDPRRVHVMGISAGGAMAGILAATYPDLYASVGIHSAPQYRAARTPVSALVAMKGRWPDPERTGRLAHAAMGPRARVVPVIVIQGGQDMTVRAGNGDAVVRQWLTASRLSSMKAGSMKAGSRKAGRGPELDFARPDVSNEYRTPGGMAYSVRTWNDDTGRPVVTYWFVEDLGHAWSGGAVQGSYTDPRGPSATAAMCDFFGQCQMDRDLDGELEHLVWGDAPSRSGTW